MSYRSRPPPSRSSGGGRYDSGRYDDRRGSFGGSSLRKTDQPGANLRAPRWETSRLMPFQKDFYQESPITASRPQEEVNQYMHMCQLKIEGSFTPRPIQSFEELAVPDYLKVPIRKQNFMKPTPIQSQAWPVALKGKDLVGIAQTGSGKTYAFVLPAVLHIKNQPPLQSGDGPIALILCPTRELSQQVAAVAEEFSESSGVRVSCIYGGAPKGPQLQTLDRGCELIIATPGRLLDFMEMRKLRLDRTTFLVLDEADRMLDMGFEPQIKKIIQFIRPDRQTVMWSATWPKEVHNLAFSFLNDFTKINVGALDLHANHNIVQVVDVCEEYEKEGKLIRLLEEIMRQPENKTIIFTETKRKADDLTGAMRRDGWPSLCIHGDKKQAEREWVLEDFKSGRTPILVATDVAARGLDISDVKYVINFDYPGSSEDYVHRIGRTARSDRTGTAYTFFTSKNFHKAADLIKVLVEANQTVPPRLRDLESFQKPGRDRGGRSRGGASDRDRGSGGKPPSINRSNAYSRGSQSSSSHSSSRRDDHHHHHRAGPPPPPPGPPHRASRPPPSVAPVGGPPVPPPSSGYGGYGRSAAAPPPHGHPPPHPHPRSAHPPPQAAAAYGQAPPPPPPQHMMPGAPPGHYGPPPPMGPPPTHAYPPRAPPSSYGGY